MKLGEFFVNLSVRGGTQSKRAVAGVKEEMKELKTMSLEAKAAIVGVIYGLEKMMAWSAKLGTNMVNFNKYTGMSTDALQKWQFAFAQVGGEADEMTQAFENAQKIMGLMDAGQGNPSGYADIANLVGLDRDRAVNDMEYLFTKLQEYAQKAPATPLANQYLESMGYTKNLIAAARQNAFRPEVMDRTPLVSNKSLQDLAKINVAWKNFEMTMQRAMLRFTAAHGMQLVTDVTKLTEAVVRLAEALVKLSDALHLFDAITKLVDMLATGTSRTAEASSNWGQALTGEYVSGADGAKGFWSFIYDTYFSGNAGQDIENMFRPRGLGFGGGMPYDDVTAGLDTNMRKFMAERNMIPRGIEAPKTSSTATSYEDNRNIKVEVHEAKNPHETSTAVEKAVQTRARTSFAGTGRTDR